MHLPEAVTLHLEPDAVHGVVGRGAGDQAVVDLDHVVRPVLAHPPPPAGQVDVPLPGPPAQPVRVASHRLHAHVELEAGQPGELLADHVRLERPLPRRRDVLEVAAAAAARAGVRAGRVDPVRRGLRHLDGVATPEPVPVGPLGDLDDDPLAGQRVPHEDHPTRAVGGMQPGDAVAAVGDPLHHDVVPLPHVGPPPRSAGAGSARGAQRCPSRPPPRRSTSPRRRSPGRTRYSSRSSRSRAISDERSW